MLSPNALKPNRLLKRCCHNLSRDDHACSLQTFVEMLCRLASLGCSKISYVRFVTEMFICIYNVDCNVLHVPVLLFPSFREGA